MPADSSKPDFWDTRFQDGVTPWDAGGELAGFFYLDDNPRGPPFGTSRDQLASLLGADFLLTAERAIPPVESLPVFQGREIWQVWERRL